MFIGISVTMSIVESKIYCNPIEGINSHIQTFLEYNNKSVGQSNYIFYLTGHDGMLWSLITLDSASINLFNGATTINLQREEYHAIDTLAFIASNRRTINWGIDSLADLGGLLIPITDESYNPFHTELYVIKDNKIVFHFDNEEHFVEPDSISHNSRLEKLLYLMNWLALPSCREYLPNPTDTLVFN